MLSCFKKKKAYIISELMRKEAAYLFQFVHYLWLKWELITTYDSVSPCLGTMRCKIVAADKIRMQQWPDLVANEEGGNA